MENLRYNNLKIPHSIGTVSHAMVNVAVKVAKNRNIPLLRSHSSSRTSLGAMLKQFEERSTCA